MKPLSVEEVLKAGGRVKLPKGQVSPLTEQYALKILGLLADLPDYKSRMRSLKAAIRMLQRYTGGTRGPRKTKTVSEGNDDD